MTLGSKAEYFYDVLMRRHIRDPWIAGQCKLLRPGDTTTWQPDDDDNDGEYTANYLAMESFRYAATGDPVAKAKETDTSNSLEHEELEDSRRRKNRFLIGVEPQLALAFSRWREKVPGLDRGRADAPKEVPKGRT